MINLERLKRDIEELGEIGRTPAGGVSRGAFSDADLQAREWFVRKLKEADLGVTIDAAGNIFGRIEGSGPAILCGSHLDTIKNGGIYDGALGVLSALECIRVINELKLKTEFPIEVVSFTDEEERFVGFLGSYAVTGELKSDKLSEVRDSEGYLLRDCMRKCELDIAEIPRAKRNAEGIKAFIELHIEQGPVLESLQIPIGVVNAVKGDYRYRVDIVGRTDHAGVPMKWRRDALFGAVQFISSALNIIRRFEREETLVTVGVLELDPGLANVVPRHVFFTLDVRDNEIDHLSMLEEELNKLTGQLASELNLEMRMRPIMKIAPLALNHKIQAIITEEVKNLNLVSHELPSGAGHDAQILGRMVPAGMIFVPSHRGKSHSPDEFTSWKDIENGANVLLRTLLHLANGNTDFMR